MDHLQQGGQAVLPHRLDDLALVDGEALADQGSLLVVVMPLDPAVAGDGGIQRLLAHHRAVHLLRGQAVEVVGDILVADERRLVEGLADDHLGQRRGGGDGTATAEGLESGIEDDFVGRIHLQHQAQRIAAADGAHIADGVGIGQDPGVTRVEKMILNFL